MALDMARFRTTDDGNLEYLQEDSDGNMVWTSTIPPDVREEYTNAITAQTNTQTFEQMIQDQAAGLRPDIQPFGSATPTYEQAQASGLTAEGDNPLAYQYLANNYSLPNYEVSDLEALLHIGAPALAGFGAAMGAGGFVGGASGGTATGAVGGGSLSTGLSGIGAVAPAAAAGGGLVGGAAGGGALSGVAPAATTDFVGGASGGTVAADGAFTGGASGATTAGAAGGGLLSGTGGAAVPGLGYSLPTSVDPSGNVIQSPTVGSSGGSWLDSLMSGAPDWLKSIPGNVWAGGLQGLVGYLGADKQADAIRDASAQQAGIANQFLARSQPSLNRFEGSFAPDFNLWDQPGYAGAFDQSANAAARAVSAKSGNPFGNPGAMGEISNAVLNGSYLPALSNYRGINLQGAGMGLNTAGSLFGQSGQGNLLGAQANAGKYDAIGYGLGTAFNPTPDINDILKNLGGSNYRLVI